MELEANYYVALHQRDLNQVNDAIAAFEAILKVKPDQASVHDELGILYLNTGKLRFGR